MRNGASIKAPTRRVLKSEAKCVEIHTPLKTSVPLETVGGTVAAGIIGSVAVTDHVTLHNAEALVSSVIRSIRSRVSGLSGPVVTIVQSLLRPFVGRFIGKDNRRFDDKEMGRLISAGASMASRIQSYEDVRNREQTYVKYWLDLYLSQLFESDPPPCESWINEQLFSGWLLTGLRRALAKKDLSFLYSLQKGVKMAWNGLGTYKEFKALISHIDRLSVCHGVLPSDLYEVIQQTSCEVFTDLNSSSFQKMVPSGKACLQVPYHKGGALSLFEPLHPQTWNSPLSLQLPISGEPSYFVSKVGVLPRIVASIDQWRQDTFEESLLKSIDGFRQPHSLLKPTPVRSVKVVTVSEPGKFRILSKACGYLSTALQPLQGQMLQCWKNSRHSSMRQNDLSEKVVQMDENCVGFDEPWVIVSGDYEAATDLMLRDATLACLDTPVFEQNPLFPLARYSMLDVVAEYPYPRDFLELYCKTQDASPGKHLSQDLVDLLKIATGAKQVIKDGISTIAFSRQQCSVQFLDGQLMGHMLSFPLLCTVNLSVLRCALQRWVKQSFDDFMEEYNTYSVLRLAHNIHRVRWENRKAMASLIEEYSTVNGDDILFKCPLSFVPFFNQAARDAGFRLSVGKNYVSPDFAMINSQVFGRKDGSMVRFGYLNQRFITGGHIQDEVEFSAATPVGLSSELNKMFNYLGNASFLPAIMSRFPQMGGDRFFPNWFLPIHLGGFGISLKWSPGDGLSLTKRQSKVARIFAESPSTLYYLKGLPKIDRKFAPRALVTFSPVFGDSVQQSFEDFDLTDPWLERFALLSRISHRNLNPAPEVAIRNIILHREGFHGKRRKIIPFCADDILAHWTIRYSGVPGPTCPPLSSLKLPVLGFGAVHHLISPLYQRPVCNNGV